MRVRALRIVLGVATAIAFWLIAAPARAEAPLCDERGASILVPSPVLPLEEDGSIEMGIAPDDCAATFSERSTYDGERHRSEPPNTSDADAVLPQPVHVLPIVPVAPFQNEEAANRGLAGVRSRVDRPPRS